jgi:hypothetical protein
MAIGVTIAMIIAAIIVVMMLAMLLVPAMVRFGFGGGRQCDGGGACQRCGHDEFA